MGIFWLSCICVRRHAAGISRTETKGAATILQHKAHSPLYPATTNYPPPSRSGPLVGTGRGAGGGAIQEWFSSHVSPLQIRSLKLNVHHKPHAPGFLLLSGNPSTKTKSEISSPQQHSQGGWSLDISTARKRLCACMWEKQKQRERDRENSAEVEGS